MAHAYLVEVVQLPRYGMPWEFLRQFAPRPLEVKISTAGALGTMRMKWRDVGRVDYSEIVVSDSAAPWTYEIGEASATVVFAAGAYVADSTYTIAEGGTVTVGGGGISTVTATRYNLVDLKSQAATDLALGWMRPRVVPPLTAWGSDVRENYVAVLHYLLKSAVGLAPLTGQPGDENIRQRFLDAEAWFKSVGRGDVPLQDLTDSSAGGLGGGLLAVPMSDDARGW